MFPKLWTLLHADSRSRWRASNAPRVAAFVPTAYGPRS